MTFVTYAQLFVFAGVVAAATLSISARTDRRSAYCALVAVLGAIVMPWVGAR